MSAPLRFVSTRGQAPAVGLSAAIAAGLAPDGGLYVPQTLPEMPPLQAGRELAQTAQALLAPWFAGDPLAAALPAARLQAKIGRTIDVILDEVDDEGGATGRSKADAPENDGNVLLRDCGPRQPGDILRVLVEDADAHDLFGVPV